MFDFIKKKLALIITAISIFHSVGYAAAFEEKVVPDDFHNFTQVVQGLRQIAKDREIELTTEFSPYDASTLPLREKIKENNSLLLRYLLRSWEAVQIDKEGRLIISEDERFFYTLWECLENIIGYRGEPSQYHPTSPPSTFYDSGTRRELLADRWSSAAEGHHYKMENMGDIYNIRDLLIDFELGRTLRTEPLSLSMNIKEDHATLIVSVLDIETKRVLASLLLNSWHSTAYYEYIKELFHLNSFRCLDPSKVDEKEELILKFGDSPKILEFMDSGFYCRWPTPFIDCSYNLQNTKDDPNCMLYAYNYSCAVKKLLGDSAQVTRIQSEARKLFVNSEDTDAIQALRTIFQEDVKPYLPQYYNGDGSRRTVEEIKEYHLRLRWELSGEQLQKFLSA